MSPLLFALFLATFAIGTTEFAVVGLLPDIAASLDVSISQTGLLVSGYAVGVAVGGPVIVGLTSSQPRKRTLLQLCAIFVVGSCSCCARAGLWLADWGEGARPPRFRTPRSSGSRRSWRRKSVPPERSSRAVSLVWLGFSAASLVGVPSTTAIGHAFGWRAAFWMLAVVGVAAGAALQLWMPPSSRREASRFRAEIVALRRPQVLLAMAMSLLVCASTFAVFTYVAPLLLEDTRISVGALPLDAVVVRRRRRGGHGRIGGRLGDWKPLELVAALSLAYAVFYLILMAVVGSVALMGAAMILWGFRVPAGPSPPLQTRVVRKAIDGPNLASTLNQSAFNVGNALGPTLGAAALALGFGYRVLPWIGSALALLCAATALLSRALDRGEPVLVADGCPSAPP